MNGSTLTLGLVAGLAVLGAARRGSAATSETAARAAAVAAEQARLDAEVDARQAKLDAARRKAITDDPDWEEWLAHLAQRVEEAKADAAAYRTMQRERAAGDAASALDRTFALESAEALVAAIRDAGGPSQLRVWTKPGLGVRVYFPGAIGHLDVGQDGSISEVSRGKLHFAESGLYPAWKKAVREGRRMYLQQLGARLAAHGEARAARVAGVREGSAGGSRALDFDFFEDEPEPQASPETRARRAFEAAAGALPETIDASDLFRAWPEGVDERVLIVQRYVRGAVPGWFVYALEAKTEAEAKRVGSRVQKALIAPRSLRANQVGLHTLPLTVGWPGGTVGVGAAR
jgi:hypothetical protein